MTWGPYIKERNRLGSHQETQINPEILAGQKINPEIFASGHRSPGEEEMIDAWPPLGSNRFAG